MGFKRRRWQLVALFLSVLIFWTQVAWGAYGSTLYPLYEIYHPNDPTLAPGNAEFNYNGYLYYTGFNQTVKVDVDFNGWLMDNNLGGATISEVYADLSSIGMDSHYLLIDNGYNNFTLQFPLPDLNAEAQTYSLPLMVQINGESSPRLAGEYNLLLNYNFPSGWQLLPDPRIQTDMGLGSMTDFQVSRPGVGSIKWWPTTTLSLVDPVLINSWQDWQRVWLEPKIIGYGPDYLLTMPNRLEIVMEDVYFAAGTGDPDIVKLTPDGSGGWLKSGPLDATAFVVAPGWDAQANQVKFTVDQPGIFAFPPSLRVDLPVEDTVYLTDPAQAQVTIQGQVQDLKATIQIYLDAEPVPRATPGLNNDGTFTATLNLAGLNDGTHTLKIKALSTNPILNEEISRTVITDLQPPAVTGVADGQTYTAPVTPVFTEGSARLNGQPFLSGTTITENGQYQLVVTDSAGHVTTITFTIAIPASGPALGGSSGSGSSSGGGSSSGSALPAGFNVPAELRAGITISPTAVTGKEPGINAGIWDITYNGSLSQPAAITFPLQTQLQDGQGAGVWYYSPLANRWLPIGGQLGADRQTITANLNHFSRYGVFLRPNSFPDLPAQHWAAATISGWAGQGRIQGYQGKFEPERTMTRAELAALLVRLLAVEDDGRSLPLPADVPASHWAARDIALVVNKGWLLGYNNRFRPQEAVTREELAVVLARLADLGASADLSSFSDNRQISPWARAAVGQAVKQGLMNGRSHSSLAARAVATRAEAVSMLYRWNKKFGLNE
ncbi:S-layer homology domain-containing protein [Carboxydocella sp. ULO1]|uniref:S-layer homology domain-containing protein n=1 Tax=Carboxydocella sp. ULO1 TaxID=1926599 RepID=UPI0009ACA031|nr:S-layer homology domain-containing protein [Carboxydocella sp. ULO1]GAW29476.1 pullulanase [Carboxydocella sp. ULO1]